MRLARDRVRSSLACVSAILAARPASAFSKDAGEASTPWLGQRGAVCGAHTYLTFQGQKETMTAKPSQAKREEKQRRLLDWEKKKRRGKKGRIGR